MTLVERYVRAVRDFLPRGQQDDITNELSDSIQSRFEDEAEVTRSPADRGRAGRDPALARPSHGCGRAISRGRPIRAIRRPADRTGALSDVPHRPPDQPRDHPDHRRRVAHRRWLDLVGDCRRRRPVRHPVHDRHPALHLGGPALAARPGRLGPAHRQLDGAGRRRVDPRWARGPADRQATHASGRDHHVRAGDRPAGDCADGSGSRSDFPSRSGS